MLMNRNSKYKKLKFQKINVQNSNRFKRSKGDLLRKRFPIHFSINLMSLLLTCVDPGNGHPAKSSLRKI